MATSYTPRLGLPEMADGEQSGYLTFNDLGKVLDALVDPVIQSRSVTDPPGSPSEGQVWYVPVGATGAWAGNEGKLAQWYNGAWVYYTTNYTRIWILDEEFLWVVGQPGIHAAMALAGAAVEDLNFTTTPTAFQIANSSIVATEAPAPSTVDLANSRITLNDYVADFPLAINAQASIIGSGNNVDYIMWVFKNGVAQPHLRSAFRATNQSPNAALVIPGGISAGQTGDQFEVRFEVSSGSQSVDVLAFSFSIMPIK